MDTYRAANLANWNERVPIHAVSREYDLDGLASDPKRLSGVVAFDAERLGDVAGARLLHLQCHIGTDTVSWAKLGAHVTGLDFSGPALDVARDLAARAGVEARFVESDAYDAPAALGGEQFDVIYTGVGALNWLPDVRRWAQVVRTLLAPGGILYVREGHPVLWALDFVRDDRQLVITHPYFETPEPLRWDDDSSYTDGDVKVANTTTYDWNHGLGEVVTAVLDVGLRLTRLEELRSLEWQGLPWMVRDDDGRWVLPQGPERLPLMYVLTAVDEPG